MASEHGLFPRALSLAVHELRTPVTVTAGYLRMLLREQAGPVGEKQRKMLEEAERSCGRINELITQMSELAKLEAGELRLATVTFDLAALVSEVASTMHEGETRGIHVEVRAPQPVKVAGDRARTAAALRALVRAAVRERGEAGVIVVACSTLAHGNDAWAVVTIGDEAVTPSLAEGARAATPPPFDEWRGGLGLALPVGRRVIEAHGGAVWSALQPNPRVGSGLRLPVAH